MSLAPLLTNKDASSAPLWGSGGGGGGGAVQNIPDLTTSTISGNPTFIGNAFYGTQPNSLGGNDGLSFYMNPPGSFGSPAQSTCGLRMDIGGQIGYVLQNPTSGLGIGNGLNILCGSGITLVGQAGAGVEVQCAGGSPGILNVSTLNVSSINTAPPPRELFLRLFAANPALSTIAYS